MSRLAGVLLLFVFTTVPGVQSSAQTSVGTESLQFRTEFGLFVEAGDTYWDADGTSLPLPDNQGGAYSRIGFDMAGSYGITPWLGIRVSTQPLGILSATYETLPERELVGFGEVRLEVPVDLLGRDAYRSSRVSVSVVPLGIFPLPGPDFEEELESRRSGESYIADRVGLGAFGAGATVAGAFRPAGSFVVEGELSWIGFLPTDYSSVSLDNYARNELRESLSGVEPYETIDYRYRAAGTMGAGLRGSIGEAAGYTVSIPLGLTYRPEPAVDGVAVRGTHMLVAEAGIDGELRFRIEGGVELSTELTFRLPVYGQNVRETQRFTLSAGVAVR